MSTIDKEVDEKEEEEDIAGQEGKIGVITKDTRLEKELIDISSGEIDDADFERLCRNVNKSKKEVFDLLAEALKRGYTKVDIAKGELSK